MLNLGNSIEEERRKEIPYCPCTYYVHRRHKHLPPDKLPAYYNIFQLPCGCRDRRGCLENTMRKDTWDGCCHIFGCGFKLFTKEWTLDEWLDRLSADLGPMRGKVHMNELAKADRECGICLNPYREIANLKKWRKASPSSRGVLESPVRLPCYHIFGSSCIKKWLSPKSEGGSQHNDCPMCRKVSTFFEHSSQVPQSFERLEPFSVVKTPKYKLDALFRSPTRSADSEFYIGVLHCVERSKRGRIRERSGLRRRRGV